jgi:TetR/AcrR family transcriptional regulator, cholesterol catabolism regulator
MARARSITSSATSGQVGNGRKAEIVAIATSLFRQNGYYATSLDDIAARMGFTKPAIYYYFESKEDILFTIVDSIAKSALVRIRAIAKREASPADRLHDLLVENTKVLLENLDANTVFYNERGLLSPSRERAIRNREREYTKVVRDLYEEGMNTGDFMEVDLNIVTATLLGASIWTYRWFDVNGPLSIDEVAEEVARILSAGYLVTP